MRLAIFGGTGRTGQHLIRQALAQGHSVTALARDPARLGAANDRLIVVKGNVTDAADVAQVVAGAEAVISVLGPASNEPTFDVSRGTAHIIAAMRQHGVKRLVISSGAGVGDPDDAPKLFHRVMDLLVSTLSKNVYLDMVKTVELVRASDLDWTIVRVPMLVDAPGTGHVKVGMVGIGVGARITRFDLAGYLLGQAAAGDQWRKAPAVSN